jgi:hypothetical protein
MSRTGDMYMDQCAQIEQSRVDGEITDDQFRELMLEKGQEQPWIDATLDAIKEEIGEPQ